MSQGELYFRKDIAQALNDAKANFPVEYEYDAWEMPETNKQKEKKLCEILVWFQKYFGCVENKQTTEGQ